MALMARDRQAAVQDIQDLKSAVAKDIQDLKAATVHDIQELKAAIEKVETTLLPGFWKRPSTNDIKIRSVATRTGDL
jgi:hypothetical protein